MKSITQTSILVSFILANYLSNAAAQNCQYPISNLSTCPILDRVQHTPATYNGCGPEEGILHRILPQYYGAAPLVNACNAHDICYGSCGSAYDKATCDNKFFKNLLSVCATAYPGQSNVNRRNGCYNLSNIYFNAVKDGGQGAYNTAQLEDCQCCDCPPPGNPPGYHPCVNPNGTVECIPADAVCCKNVEYCSAPASECCDGGCALPGQCPSPTAPEMRVESLPATPTPRAPAPATPGTWRSLSVTTVPPGSPGTWTGLITSPGADPLGVQFILGEQNGMLSGSMFLADPDSGDFVELDSLTGSRTGNSATWTTTTGVIVTGSFDFTKAVFSGTLQFPLYEGSAPLVTQLSLRGFLSRCPPPEQPCAGGCCQSQCGPHFVPCATGCCPEPP
jgi:hypothetical protein